MLPQNEKPPLTKAAPHLLDSRHEGRPGKKRSKMTEPAIAAKPAVTTEPTAATEPVYTKRRTP